MEPFRNPFMPRRAEIRFTDAYVKSLKPAQNRYDVYDAALAGFGMRVSTSGTKSWVVLSRTLNRKTRATLGRYPQMSLAEARLCPLCNRWQTVNIAHQVPRSFEHAWIMALARSGIEQSFAQVKSTWNYTCAQNSKTSTRKDIKKRDLIKIIDRIGSTAPTQANRV